MNGVGGRSIVAALPDSHSGKSATVVMGKAKVVDGLSGLECPRRTATTGAWTF